MSGVNYFFRSATITFPYQRQLLLRRRGAPQPRGRAQPAERPSFGLRGETGIVVAKRGWESGKPDFGFPLFQTASPELWECGNLAWLWRDYQEARGKSGKPAFGLPRFPQPRHFHSSPGPRVFAPPLLLSFLRRLTLGLLFLLGLLFPIARNVQLDDHAVAHSRSMAAAVIICVGGGVPSPSPESAGGLPACPGRAPHGNRCLQCRLGLATAHL